MLLLLVAVCAVIVMGNVTSITVINIMNMIIVRIIIRVVIRVWMYDDGTKMDLQRPVYISKMFALGYLVSLLPM